MTSRGYGRLAYICVYRVILDGVLLLYGVPRLRYANIAGLLALISDPVYCSPPPFPTYKEWWTSALTRLWPVGFPLFEIQTVIVPFSTSHRSHSFSHAPFFFPTLNKTFIFSRFDNAKTNHTLFFKTTNRDNHIFTMHFHKITGLALALAPLSMAGACPAKPYQSKPAVSSPPDVPEVTPVPYQTPTQPADAPIATAPATDAAAPETTTKAQKHTRTKSKHHGHRKTSSGSPAEQTPSAPEQTPSAPEETPSAPEQTPAEPKTEPTPSGPAPPPAAKKSASPAPAGPKFVGLGTRYGLDYPCTEADCWQKGSCSFTDYKLPAGIDGTTCVSEEIWDNGAHCGGCISVTYKGKTLTIMVGPHSGFS